MRIKANELRIGNLINVKKFDIDIPSQITSGSDIDGINVGKPVASGIPLTDEWLLKFGFVKSDKVFYLKGFKVDLDEFYINIYVDWCSNNDSIICYESHDFVIHKLQNLYFALTGKELEVVNEN